MPGRPRTTLKKLAEIRKRMFEVSGAIDDAMPEYIRLTQIQETDEVGAAWAELDGSMFDALHAVHDLIDAIGDRAKIVSEPVAAPVSDANCLTDAAETGT